MKNPPRIHATSVNLGKSRAMTIRLNANMLRNSIASRFWGVRNRSTFVIVVAGSSLRLETSSLAPVAEIAAFSGLVGSCVRS